MTNTREPLLAEVIDLIVESLNLHFVEKSELGPETVLGLTREPLLAEVIDLIVESLNLHFVEKSELGPETVLGLGGLELDSIDILEVVVGIEKRYSIKIKNAEEGKKVFASIGSIIEFIQENQGASSESGQPKS